MTLGLKLEAYLDILTYGVKLELGCPTDCARCPTSRTMVTASGEVPPPLLFFTCLVCTGVMANFTLLVPVSTYYSATLLESGVIVSSYAGGAIVSLFFWSQMLSGFSS